MSQVLDLLSSELDEDKIRDIARHLDADESQTEAAIAAALPTMVSVLSRHAETPQGAERITHQIQGIGGGSLGDLLGGILGGKSDNRQMDPRSTPLPSGLDLGLGRLPPQENSSALDRALGPGNELPSASKTIRPGGPSEGFSSGSIEDIFGDALGGKKKRVEESIGRSSGLDLKKIGPLIAILGPLVLGAIRSQANVRTTSSSTNFNPGDLTEMMRDERKSVEKKQGGSMIGRMLDQDGDGDFDLSDIIKLGMRFLFSRK